MKLTFLISVKPLNIYFFLCDLLTCFIGLILSHGFGVSFIPFFIHIVTEIDCKFIHLPIDNKTGGLKLLQFYSRTAWYLAKNYCW